MRKTRKPALALALTLALSVFLSACGPKQSAPPEAPKTDSTTAPAQTTPVAKKPAVGGEINLRLDKDADNFNPILSSTSYGSEIYQHVYDSLFEFNEKWEPTPRVAEKWSWSADSMTFTVKIREGIKFTDGGDLTAEDVVFTLMSIKDPGYTGPRASSMTDIESVTAPDKYTVEFKLKKPFAPIFTNINYGILQKKLFEGTSVADMANHKVTMNPVGSGPYILKEYVRGQYAILERNPNWFRSAELGGAPFIQTIRYKVIPDDQTGLAAFENGEIDWAQPTPEEVSRIEKEYAGKVVPVDYERNGWGYMSFNTTRAPLDDKRVRQALVYGLDRQSIIDGVMDGRAVIPSGPIPPVSWAFDSSLKPTAYDKDKAKKLLEEAGYKMGANGMFEKNGQPLKLTFYGSSGSTLIEGLATMARKNWKDIGVELDVQLMDFNAMTDNYLKPGNFDVSFAGFSLGLDPDSLYGIFHGSLATPNAKGEVSSFNKMRYVNPELDKLLEAGRAEGDPAKRKTIYSKAQQIIVDDAPVLLVYANLYNQFHSPKLKGVINFPGSGATTSKLFRWYINEQ